MVKVPLWQGTSSPPPPPRGAPAGSGRRALPGGEVSPPGAQPPPRVLELAATKTAHFPAFDHVGPPSALYSNGGSESTSASMYNTPSTASTAGFQPPTAGGRASQSYADEATRDGEEDVAKAAWLANQNGGAQPPAQGSWAAPAPEPWQAQPAPEPWNLSPNGAPAAQAPQRQAEAPPQQAEDAAPKGYLQDPGGFSQRK